MVETSVRADAKTPEDPTSQVTENVRVNEMDEKNENEGTVDTSELIEKRTALSRDVLLKDAVEEDVRRAELYVATARPTKIAIRFVRRRREEEERERRVVRFSDGEWVPATGGGKTTSVPRTVVADDDEATQRQAHAVTEQANVQMMDTKRVENTVPESPKTANKSSATINTDITTLRQERKRARKAAKRLKAKARVARQRREAYANEVQLMLQYGVKGLAKPRKRTKHWRRADSTGNWMAEAHETSRLYKCVWRNINGLHGFSFRTVFGELLTVDACVIVGCEEEFLLGVDFMQNRGATIDFQKQERPELIGNTVTPVEVSVSAEDGELGLFLPTRHTGSVLFAATVTTARNGRAWVLAINTNTKSAKIPNKKELGTWMLVDSEMEIFAMKGQLNTGPVEKWLSELGGSETPLPGESEVDIGSDDPNAREMVLKLLRAYRSLTKDTSASPPATSLDVHHYIDTGDASPIMLKRRRQAQTDEGIIDSNVETMLMAGVIEEGNGGWGFPVVLVRKKDGEVRLCVDYRALNKITKKDICAQGTGRFLVAPEDRDKTAYTTKKGLYRFVRIPFGLTNAPSTFQRLMNGVLRSLAWSSCLMYLDDIVVFTQGGIERHIVELATVLERLERAGRTLKLRKCKFATQTIAYLGHELSSNGVRPLDRLVAAVRDFPTPTNAVETKRFAHLAGYYRIFVSGFGALLAPITKLLSKSWGDSQNAAFEKVKAILTTKPLLAYPDF
ncbi:Gag-pol fusion protein [Phytophthora megakarya]|uniref:Gag-pol fusion protein n=1 Tax=Phytophthora megakarya TaxID=4795 RepID=A0A225VKK2_9STRA|nr:Gag-pol fusion protein [Phytophthora megakarya]